MQTLRIDMGMKINDKIYRKKVKKLEKYVARRLPDASLKEFKANTPIDKGNARRNTTLRKRPNQFIIKGDYDYSGVLDRGLFPDPPSAGTGKTRGGYSTQAPKGMIEPTLKFIEDAVRKFIKRNT